MASIFIDRPTTHLNSTMAPYSSPPTIRRSRSTTRSHSRRPSIQRHHDHLPLPRTSCGGINPTASRSIKHRPGTANTSIMTEAEFLQLPESIQRKCFSSFERLKIRQTSAQLICDPNFVPRPVAWTASVVNVVNPPSNRSLRSARGRLQKPQSIWADHLIAQAEAQWFLSLPDKVRRQHFTREEQILLASRLNLSTEEIEEIEDESYEIIPYEKPIPTTPNSDVDCCYSESDIGVAITIEDAVVVPLTPVKARRHSSEQSTSVPSFEQTPPPFTSVDDLHDAMNCFEDPSNRPRPARKQSLRRRLSASRPSTGIFRNSTSSTPPLSPAVKQQHNRTRSAATTLVRPSTDSAARAFDPNAVHYRDPEARNKLRQYLASPQKFDEAVEFGFPSTSASITLEPEPTRPNRKSTSNNDAQTFLRDDVISFIDRYDEHSEDGSSDAYSESPVTPADANDGFKYAPGTRSLFSSLDSTDLPPLDFKFRQFSFPQDPMANREMTLRMTLTRPDLRAPEEELYGWQESPHADLLALEDLPPATDDDTGAHGPFASTKVSRNSGVFRLRRIFSKVKKERR